MHSEQHEELPQNIESPAALSHEEKTEVPRSNKRSARSHDEEKTEVPSSNKRSKSSADDIASMKKRNFIRACELVSQRAYCDYAERFQLIYMPVCIDRKSCVHSSTKPLVIKEIPMKIATLMKTEIDGSQWHGALEVCIMSITPIQYLSEIVLKDVVEIILNTHEDLSSGYTVTQVIDKCKLVLSLQFSTHCPCQHVDIHKMYTKFLTWPMPKKENTRTNRTEFASDKGIVSFCLTRLEYELGTNSSDGPLLDKLESTPEDLRETVKGKFYQREQFEIFEMLHRNERIDRLMEVLHSLIELLQADLAVWQSSRDSDTRRQRRQLLMASVLWNEKCEVTDVCRLIIKIFSYFIHLEYPEQHIKTMTLWLNILMEAFYSKENSSNINFPSPGSCCIGVVIEFYKIIKNLPKKSILSILEMIKPAFIRHQVGLLYSNVLLNSDENEILRLVIDFLNESKWKDFPEDESDKIVLKTLNVKRVKPNKLLKHLSMICNNTEIFIESNDVKYPRFCPDSQDKEEISQRLVVYTLYITLRSYLEAYGVQSIQETLQNLNKDLMGGGRSEDPTLSSLNFESKYAVNDDFIKKYRNMFEMLKELVLKLKEIEANNNTPEVVNIFNNLFD